MIVLKTARELKMMREAGRISAKALQLVGEAVEPGVSTYDLDKVAYDYIKSQGATPGFLNYSGFPASACISINNEVIHGIPSKRRIVHAGDIVSVDLGAVFEGYNGDNAATFAAGDVSPEAERLMAVTEESLYEGIKMAQVGGRIGDIGAAIQGYVQAVFHCRFRCGLSRSLRCKGCGFSGAPEAQLAGGRPGKHVALHIGNRNNGIVEGRLDMGTAALDIFLFAAAACRCRLCSCHILNPLSTFSCWQWSSSDPCVYARWF